MSDKLQEIIDICDSANAIDHKEYRRMLKTLAQEQIITRKKSDAALARIYADGQSNAQMRELAGWGLQEILSDQKEKLEIDQRVGINMREKVF